MNGLMESIVGSGSWAEEIQMDDRSRLLIAEDALQRVSRLGCPAVESICKQALLRIGPVDLLAASGAVRAEGVLRDEMVAGNGQ